MYLYGLGQPRSASGLIDPMCVSGISRDISAVLFDFQNAADR
jgi:hypothetical protein